MPKDKKNFWLHRLTRDKRFRRAKIICSLKSKTTSAKRWFLKWSQGELNPLIQASTMNCRTSGGPMTPRNNSNTIFAKTKSEIFFQKSRILGLQLQSMVDLISIANTGILSIANTKNKIKLILGKIINLFSSAPHKFCLLFYLSTIIR